MNIHQINYYLENNLNKCQVLKFLFFCVTRIEILKTIECVVKRFILRDFFLFGYQNLYQNVYQINLFRFFLKVKLR